MSSRARTNSIEIKILKTRDEISKAFPLISQLHTSITREFYESCVTDILAEGVHTIIAAYDKAAGKMIGTAGFEISTRFYCGKSIRIGGMVVDTKYRNRGIGRLLIDFIEQRGKEAGCKHAILDSYTGNTKSHKLYFQSDFFIRGFHFMKEI